MIWKNILQEIFQHNSAMIFCLHGHYTPQTPELHELKESLRKNHLSGKSLRANKIILLPSRAHYIRRHQHEGLFFQQRFQASWKDEGETVRQKLMTGLEDSTVTSIEEWKEWFELDEIWDKPLLQLSSGEWQRFSLCHGLLAEAKILIVPDLLKGLDHRWQQKILAILSDRLENGKMVIFTSDIPARHPSVMNIHIDSGPDQPRNISVRRIPASLIKAFQQYQSGFLQSSSQDVLVHMNGVSIKYGNKKILDDIHWSVRTGDKWNIQGANGAGKSTLVSLINADNPQGYSQPVELFGEKYGQYSIWERKARIAFFGSDFFQYFRSSKTMEEVLHQQLQTPYLDTIQPREFLINELMAYFDLREYTDTPYSTLSAELRRQTLLLASYLKSSDVLVLDEPYQDLSHERIQLNNRFLESVQPQSSQTVLFVTHREDHKPGFLDKIMVMEEPGR